MVRRCRCLPLAVVVLGAATEAELHSLTHPILRSIQTAKNFFQGSFSKHRGTLGVEPRPSIGSSK
ncbi:unnamed protein product [Spirodela intermedia]|uniref:Uncharacterized protein n=1 Tax=Spirodela intermedia TaxID=51605 RepID=A0A7I8JNV0_SPIIN|nr:unnamed protein product [Spirodela intermedia]CAA6671132.1 unnamed protein product [Spirodela intermedia]